MSLRASSASAHAHGAEAELPQSLSTPPAGVHRSPRAAPANRVPIDAGPMRAFDVCGTLRRIRRLADLSQRELAAELLVSKSSIAAVETGDRGIDVLLLARAAALAGLRLALIGEDGQEVAPMADDAVRDLSRRWFPAHLDTRRSDEDGWLYEPRRDRPETRFTFTR